VRQVAVIGTGTMAPGIAVAFAESGYEVTVVGRSADRARSCLHRAAELAAFLEANQLGAPATAISARIRASQSLADLAVAGLIVEAVAEDLAIKQEVLGRAEAACGSGALLATNTSGLSVTEMARGLQRPERILAMHFWNPAHLMPIVEIAGGTRTDDRSIEQASDIVRGIGKIPVRLRREIPGFLGTRLQQAVVREAIALVQAGVASAEDVDLATRASFGIRFPVIGPLESADISGLDVILAVHEYLLPDLDRSPQAQPLLRELVGSGRLGLKSGAGFHSWSPDAATAVLRRRDEELVRRLRLLAGDGQIHLASHLPAEAEQ